MPRPICQTSGKVRHRSRGVAALVMRRVNNAGLASYPCSNCGGWHLGTSKEPFRQQARISQLLTSKPPPAED